LIVSALTEDNILESIVQNGEECALQLVNYYISNQVTQIRNTSTITERKEVICETSLIDNFSHQNNGEYDLYTRVQNMTYTHMCTEYDLYTHVYRI